MRVWLAAWNHAGAHFPGPSGRTRVSKAGNPDASWTRGRASLEDSSGQASFKTLGGVPRGGGVPGKK